MNWKPIETRPTKEMDPFLVLRYGNDACDYLVQQVTVFEGQMYPDELNYNVDFGDRVVDAVFWCEIGPIPQMVSLEVNDAVAPKGSTASST